ncbi:MAG: CvpA family protein [Gammaproteobacteria bacterium]|nr:CvpA family protein [Gammaproteobacteria bacterium]
MNWIDIFILSVLGISAVLSLFRGLVREVLSLVAWVVAGWVAFKFAGPVSAHFAGAVSLPSVRMAVAFGLLLLGVLLVFGVFNFLLGKLIDSTGLSGTDRLLGMFFGLARGIAIVTVLVALAGLTPVPRDPWWKESRLLDHFEQLARYAVHWLPPEFAKHFSYETASPEPVLVAPPTVKRAP